MSFASTDSPANCGWQPGSMTDPVLPVLWLVWCAVTGTPIDRRDEATLGLFVWQAGPSQKVLHALRPSSTAATAPAWPAAVGGDGTALGRLVHGGTSSINDPDVHWITRLRLRRRLFSAVLLAPTVHGGLSLSRTRVRSLTQRLLQVSRAGSRWPCHEWLVRGDSGEV